MDETSLIPDESRALIGELMQEPVTATITARESQRYAMAVDDLNPVYFDEDAAKAAGYRTLVAPPTFVGHVVAATKPQAELRPDGLYQGGPRLGLRVKRVMAGGDQWEFLMPPYVGDVITAETRLHSLDQRDGRSGAFVTTVTQTTFTNQDGELVARLLQTGIAR
jgi:acyl dehydratase